MQTAIAKLGFVRNYAARQLRVGRSRMIGLIVLDMSNPLFADVARGADGACEQFDTAVLVGNSDQDLGREARYLDAFEEQRVRGVLLSPRSADLARAERLASQGIPVVLVDRMSPRWAAIPSVSVGDERGGWLAARHLIESGRRRLAFVGNSNPPLHRTRDRLAGVRPAVADAIDVSMETLVPPDATLSAGRIVARELLARAPEDRPDAIVCPTDVGATAVALLEQIISGAEPDTRNVVFQPELVVRESS